MPEKGDAKWLDHQGSFMAAVAAEPVFRLLGAKDLGVTEDYHTAKMPPVNVGLLDGQLAWRQHDGGHTDAPNWKYFIPWADKFLHHRRALRGARRPDQPVLRERTDANSQLAHEQLLAKAKQGRIDVYFEGDSITRRWGATDYPQLLENWKKNFFGWNAADFGWGADRVENILWRLENGELDGVNPKVIVLLAGTNNVGNQVPPEGVEMRGRECDEGPAGGGARDAVEGPERRHHPDGDLSPQRQYGGDAGDRQDQRQSGARWRDGAKIRYLNINDKLADGDGKSSRRHDERRDKLHPTLKGYQVWADALKPHLHGTARTARQGRSRAAAYRRSLRAPLTLRAYGAQPGIT